MAGFGKMAYLGLKSILDDLGVVYDSRQITQAYALKKKLEARGYKRGDVTIVSVDITKMYLSMRFSLLEDAVLYYTRGMSREVRDRAGICLEMLQFGMDRTYLQFGDKYYHYEGAGVPGDPGLTIGGYESAWMADLGLAYLMEQIPSIVNRTEFLEFYRDDGLVIFDGNVTKEYVHNWVNRLQTKIDRVTGAEPGEHIVEFTAVMWGDAELDGTFVSDTIKVTRSDAFPYLDMQMFWSTDGDLHFKVHYKQHQRVIYLNNDSCHRRSTFNSIPNGVFIRLARLTTMTAANRGQRLDTLYPINAMALRKAGLAPKVFPTLEEAMVLVHRRDALDDTDADSAQTTPETLVPGRDTFAKIGFSHFWSVPIHVKLAQLNPQGMLHERKRTLFDWRRKPKPTPL